METLRRAPSRTFVPLALPVDIIDFPKVLHPRVAIAIRISAPIFMGGATVEGAVELTIDGGPKIAREGRKQAPISIDRISVALVGVERSGARQHMFMCLMTDLIDEAHLPPIEMARPNQPVSDQLWEVMPSRTTLPFRINLPVMLGPPPYHSKKNNVRYLISVLVEAKINGKRTYVRRSEEVMALTVHDPEKALVNLPNPLVVTDEVQSSHRGSLQTVVLTAGVHRQTWISGYPLFVDVRISNRGVKIRPQTKRESGIHYVFRTDNSIDIPPNSLAQVAATIEHKNRHQAPTYPHTSYNYHAGQAFLAARQQSFEQVNRDTLPPEEIKNLSQILDEPLRPTSPQQPRRRASTSHISANPNLNAKIRCRNSRFLEGSESFRNPPHSPPRPCMAAIAPSPQRPPPAIPKRRVHRGSLEEQSSRQHLLDRQAPTAVHRRRTRSSLEDSKPKGPRLQRSTSGLKFSSSDEDDGEVEDMLVEMGARERRSIRGL
ncbi:MAG: hypothetical protein LQ343_000518 [Gyalolechia ehrenbergii]|nr:MAG: hypothetical protein LQ343_000518 [Gyalolechia ehrenbergii]